MIKEICNHLETIIELILVFGYIYIIKKYLFLEPDMDKSKQSKYNIICILVIIGTYFVLGENAILVTLVLSALSISLGRKNKRVSGFFLIFPMMGYTNGFMVPIVVLPSLLFEFTQFQEKIYSLAIYAVIILGLLLFYFKGKNWRRRFEKEREKRFMHKWERVFLCIVGLLLIAYSYTMSTVPSKEIADTQIIAHMKVDKIITGIVVFVITLTVIMLIAQGNKRHYYYEQSRLRSEKIEKMSKQMVLALANTIDAKDSYTNGHSTRVAKYSVMIAKQLGYDGEKLEQLEYAAMLHDIGKIGVPREIINKPSRLTDEEYEIIKTHPGIGASILKEISEIPDIAIGARWHHERYDGKGYPDKLTGDSIPQLARIIGVADAYDAMTSKRSYRDVLAQDIVRSEIKKGKGTQFDPVVAEVMLELIDEDKNYVMHE
ncbi:MAG: HD-GYP domain-containing protein [Lachnospiraceae bacterium]|nr:HD-GYP domain-containing protein [Lachnospiraceae bacterium]